MLELDDGTSVAADVLVLATGRRPNIDDLGLEAAGISLREDGAIRFDDHCAAGPGVWAVGDVTGKAQFTHVAKYQGASPSTRSWADPDARSTPASRAWCSAIPEIATVGLTAEQAATAGRELWASEVDLTGALARPWTYEREPTNTALGLLADARTVLLLGAWAVAPQASEWIHQAALAIRARIPIESLLDQVAPFPTYSEGYLAALEELQP